MAAGALNTLPLQTIAPEFCRCNRKNTAVRWATYAPLILRATVTNINIRHNIAPTTKPLIHSKTRIMSPGVKLWLAGRQPSPVAGCPR